MLPKIEYAVLREAAASLDFGDLPPADEVTDEMRADEGFQRKVHHALLDIHVMEGALICPESGRSFPVTGGIPNMLLHEDEV